MPINTAQQKTKRVNELLLKTNINPNYTFSTSEWQDLESIAQDCDVKGWYVVQARVMINNTLGQVIDYDDSCEDNKNQSLTKAKDEKPNELAASKRLFNLYPNPNNGNMVLSYNLGDDKMATMQLVDVTGKLINTYDLQTNTGSIEINESQLQNGIYFYRILVLGKTINTNKVVIIK